MLEELQSSITVTLHKRKHMFLLKKQKSVHKQEVQSKKCDNKFMNEIWECGFVFLLKKKISVVVSLCLSCNDFYLGLCRLTVPKL